MTGTAPDHPGDHVVRRLGIWPPDGEERFFHKTWDNGYVDIYRRCKLRPGGRPHDHPIREHITDAEWDALAVKHAVLIVHDNGAVSRA